MKKHWYHACYMYQLGSGGISYASGSFGFDEMKVTAKRMEWMCEQVGAPAKSTMVLLSYLGHMTPSEFNE